MKVLTKLEITNRLARRYGYRSLLEISTPNTGYTNGEFDREQLTQYDQLTYRCNDAGDAVGSTFRTGAESSQGVTRQLLEERACDAYYDMVFVDPFHTYESTMDDLLSALALVRPGGAVVVHDCHPTDPEIVSPIYPGYETPWCGVTYWAFIDFVLGRGGITYYTVDADYGCGVVRKGVPKRHAHDVALELAWRAAARCDEQRYAFFRQHENRLLRLISPAQFLAVSRAR